MGGRHFHYGDGHGGCGFSLRYLPGSVLPLVVHFLSGSRTLTALSMKRACLSLRCALEIMRLGVAGCVMQATNALVLVAATSTLRSVGSDVYIGILTILSSVRDVVVVPIHGLTGAAQAVIGFNFGAGKLKRVLTGGGFLTPVSTGYMILAWGLIFLFPGAVLGLFSADPQILEQGIPACHVYFFGFFMMAFHMTGQNVFVALGRYRQALFFSLLRKAFVVVPLTLILPRVTDLGVRGVFLAEPI